MMMRAVLFGLLISVSCSISAFDVLLVAPDSTKLSVSEAILKERLERRFAWDVTVISAGEAVGHDRSGIGLIILSPDCPATTARAFRLDPIPVVSANGSMSGASNLGVTSSSSSSEAEMDLIIPEADHFVTRRFAPGLLEPMWKRSLLARIGIKGDPSIVILSAAFARSGSAAILGFDKGARMYLINAPARRMHFFSLAIEKFTREGLELLDATLLWTAELENSGDLPPRITLIEPGLETHSLDADKGFSFTAEASGTNVLAASGVRLFLNGTTAEMEFTSTGKTLSARVAGLQPGTLYEARLEVRDEAGRSDWLTWHFNTAGFGEDLLVEAEDYNYGTGTCDEPGDEGGLFLDGAGPSGRTANGAVVNPDGYVNRTARAEIDYHDFSVAPSGVNSYRDCDLPQSRISEDPAGAERAALGLPEYELAGLLTGEWLNYTRTFSPGTYRIWLRARATLKSTILLQETLSDPTQPNQQVFTLGAAHVQRHRHFGWVPVTDVFGAAVALPIEGKRSFRFFVQDSANTLAVNYIYFERILDATEANPYVSEMTGASGNGLLQDESLRIEIFDPNSSFSVSSLRAGDFDLLAGAQSVRTSAGLILEHDLASRAELFGSTVVLEGVHNGEPIQRSWTLRGESVLPLHPEFASSVGTGQDPGFEYEMFQLPMWAAHELSSFSTRWQLRDVLDVGVPDYSTGLPYPNVAVAVSTAPQVLNFDQNGQASGFLTSDTGHPDAGFPGVDIEESGGDPDVFVFETRGYIELPAGEHRLGVRANEGFFMIFEQDISTSPGRPPYPWRFSLGTKEFTIAVSKAGLYGFELYGWENAGPSEFEFYHVDPVTREKVLVNDVTDARSFRVFRERIQAPPALGSELEIIHSSPSEMYHDAKDGLKLRLVGDSPIASFSLVLNNVDVTSDLFISGTDTEKFLTYANLSPNKLYKGELLVQMESGEERMHFFSWNTIDPANVIEIELEDFNFDGGKFLTNSAPGAYAKLSAREGTDYAGSFVGSPGVYRPRLTMKRIAEPRRPRFDGHFEFALLRLERINWVNYSRVIPTNSYHIYLRGWAGAASTLHLQRISDPTVRNPQVTGLGSFLLPGAASPELEFVPLTDAFGVPKAIQLGGTEHLRLAGAFPGGFPIGNYILLVPSGAIEGEPYLANLSPLPWSNNSANLVVQGLLAGVDNVDTSTLKLWVDGMDQGDRLIIERSVSGLSFRFIPEEYYSPGVHQFLLQWVGDGAEQSFSWEYEVRPYAAAKFKSVRSSPSGIEVTFDMENGWQYSIEHSPRLEDPIWSTVLTTSSSSVIAETSRVLPFKEGTGFYRIRMH